MPGKILVIENDEELVEILSELLTDEGYNVKFLSQTYDICQIAEEYVPDLVLLDFLLPEINGGELCAQLKGKLPTRHIPVIIFSAFSRVMLSLGDYGCNAFIAKPFDLSNLLWQINACIAEPDRIFLHPVI